MSTTNEDRRVPKIKAHKAHLDNTEADAQLDSTFLMSLLDEVEDGVILFDDKNHIVFANRSASTFLARSEEDLTGQCLHELLHGLSCQKPECTMLDRFLAADNERICCSFIRSDKSLFPVEYRCSRIASSKFSACVLRFADVTEKLEILKVKKELQESQDRYSLAVDGAMDGIWDLDMKTNAVYFSKPFFETLGYDEHELPGTLQTFYNLCHSDDVQRVNAAVREHILRGTAYADVEFRLRKKDGSFLWFIGRGKALRDETGKAVRFAGSNREIGAQKNAENMLRASEKKFRTLEENINAIFWICSADGMRFQYLSPAFEKITGISPQAVYKDHTLFLSIFVPEDRQSAAKSIVEDRTDNEFRIVNANGEICWIVARTFHVYEPDGTVSKICGVAYDVSIKKEAEKRVNEFYSVISHELRTPLTSIRGALGLIQGGVVGWGTDMSKEMVNVAIESSDRLIRLINDILDIKKIEAGQIKLSRVAVDCTTPMKAAKEVLDGMAKHVGCEVTYKPADKLTVIGDEDKLTQVLVNLVSNAIKFSGEGKHVSIYADRTEQNSVRFSVQDDGPGISQKDQSRLFKKFQQLDSSDTRGQGGTGLGLAIAKAMVEHHGGIIGVDSELGKGSTFWFEIPADS